MENLIEIFFNTIAIVGLVAFVWLVFATIVHMWITSGSNYWKKRTKTYLLSKSEKYKGRTSPIYKLTDTDYGGYCVERYTLKYNEVYEFWVIFLFYPVSFYKWGYSEDQCAHICNEREDIEKTLNGKTIKEFYETNWKKVNKEWDEYYEENNKINNLIGEQNKEFNENYIK